MSASAKRTRSPALTASASTVALTSSSTCSAASTGPRKRCSTVVNTRASAFASSSRPSFRTRSTTLPARSAASETARSGQLWPSRSRSGPRTTRLMSTTCTSAPSSPATSCCRAGLGRSTQASARLTASIAATRSSLKRLATGTSRVRRTASMPRRTITRSTPTSCRATILTPCTTCSRLSLSAARPTTRPSCKVSFRAICSNSRQVRWASLLALNGVRSRSTTRRIRVAPTTSSGAPRRPAARPAKTPCRKSSSKRTFRCCAACRSSKN